MLVYQEFKQKIVSGCAFLSVKKADTFVRQHLFPSNYASSGANAD